MTTMQLHMGKVWFAGKASNWDLARYELDELREAMEAAQSLHVTKNGVDISKVLAAVSQSQISPLSEAVDKKNQSNFAHAYDEALSACNGCHEESGHRFIKITRPTAPPVTNQKWDVTGWRGGSEVSNVIQSSFRASSYRLTRPGIQRRAGAVRDSKLEGE